MLCLETKYNKKCRKIPYIKITNIISTMIHLIHEGNPPPHFGTQYSEGATVRRTQRGGTQYAKILLYRTQTSKFTLKSYLNKGWWDKNLWKLSTKLKTNYVWSNECARACQKLYFFFSSSRKTKRQKLWILYCIIAVR